ncbi:hypothetical protein NX059_006585 [Plenodomus lindquistii]|nr:hypothetical protein NX059_006585 [Plenodomus lindquistii]
MAVTATIVAHITWDNRHRPQLPSHHARHDGKTLGLVKTNPDTAEETLNLQPGHRHPSRFSVVRKKSLVTPQLLHRMAEILLIPLYSSALQQGAKFISSKDQALYKDDLHIAGASGCNAQG